MAEPEKPAEFVPDALTTLMHDHLDELEALTERARTELDAIKAAIVSEIASEKEQGTLEEKIETAMAVAVIAFAKKLAPITTDAVRVGVRAGRETAKEMRRFSPK